LIPDVRIDPLYYPHINGPIAWIGDARNIAIVDAGVIKCDDALKSFLLWQSSHNQRIREGNTKQLSESTNLVKSNDEKNEKKNQYDQHNEKNDDSLKAKKRTIFEVETTPSKNIQNKNRHKKQKSNN
jgi:hypothetical protein